MPDWLTIVMLGMIEGVTEFLPVSSTGHLLLAEHWLPRQSDLFNTVIQCGAVLAVIFIFAGRLKELVFNWKAPECKDYLLKLTVAFIITGIGGVLLKKSGFKLTDQVTPVALATLLGGFFFLAVESWLGKGFRGNPLISWRVAIAVGLAQLIAALFPGTSRSGVTILTALLFGVGRPAATEFSFLLGIPTLLSAGALQIAEALLKPKPLGAHPVPVDWWMVLLGSAVAAGTAFAVVRWLLRFVQTHTFIGFAYYRIILGLLLLIFVTDPP